MEVTSSIPPAKMFKAFVLDVDNLIPKVLPQAIKCVEIIEGDGGPGTIKKITFGEAVLFFFSLTRWYAAGSQFNYVKLVASPDGGSICKNISKYHTKGDIQITEDQIKAGKEKAMGMFKAIEAYLLANPDAY
ncbi:hypothetical protein AAG906_027524 [Vitis piasezkii]